MSELIIKVKTTNFTATTIRTLTELAWPKGVSIETKNYGQRGIQYRFNDAVTPVWISSKELCLLTAKAIKAIKGVSKIILQDKYGVQVEL